MTKRKICVVTGTQSRIWPFILADEGRIQAEPSLELQLIVTGMHLSQIWSDLPRD